MNDGMNDVSNDINSFFFCRKYVISNKILTYAKLRVLNKD